MKRLRSEAKDKLEKLLQHDSPEGMQGKDDLVRKCNEVVEKAKYQSFKRGMARFVTQQEIKVQSKNGQRLRQNLREMYNLNSLVKKFLDYVGKADEQIVLDILALDKKGTSDKNAGKTSKPASKLASDGAGIAPPAKKRKGV